MSTERLYYNDCYGVDFDAVIVEKSDDGRKVYLERTLFYPTSGGQPHDTGTLDGVAVEDVIDEGERIAHVLAAPLGEAFARGEIDWGRRYDHMQQHTGQHLLSAVFKEILQAEILSFHMGPAVSTVELQLQELKEPDIERIEARVNELARAAMPVHFSYTEAQAVEGLRKPSARAGTLRIVEIEGLDRSACGGTHVRSIAEAGPVYIRGIDKVRGHVRVEFVCGARALKRARMDFLSLSRLARDCGTGIDEVADAVSKLRTRGTEAEKQLRTVSAEAARLEAATLYKETEPGRNGVRRFALQRHSKDLASALASLPRVLVVMASETGESLLIAASKDSGFHAGDLLKGILAKHGGRGGGSAQMAQGTLPSKCAAVLAIQELSVEAEDAEQRATSE